MNYKRLVSYIYIYEQEVKGSNIGFAKLDSREDICKLAVNVKVPEGMQQGSYSIFLVRREGKVMEGVKVGIARVINGNIEFRKELKSSDILNTGYSIDDIDGILLTNEAVKNHVMFSEWADKPIDFAGFVEFGQVNHPVIELMRDYIKENDNSQNTVKENTKSMGNINETNAETVEIKMATKPKDIVWEEFLKRGEKTEVQGRTELECVRIKPCDIAALPKKYWILGSNSFVLHAYYNYRYLIMCHNDIEKYMLLVPGIYTLNEKTAAAMFGFLEFLEIGVNDKNDKWGYWTMKIEP